jgi:dihydrofolate reductase
MIVSLIVAVAENNVIGKDNDLIWHLPKDMAFFKETTLNHYVVTGRKNYESIPPKYRPLKGRTNVVVTRQQDYSEEGCLVVHSIEDGIELAKVNGESECFIIGGGQIYKSVLEKGLVNRLYITHILESFKGDTFFPTLNEGEWEEETLLTHLKDEKNKHSFVIKKYTKP